MLERFVRRVVLAPGLSGERYDLASTGAEALLAEKSDDITYRNLLGMAHYRLAQYDTAIKYLSRPDDDVFKADEHEVHRVAFLAMAYFKVGNVEMARNILTEMQVIVAKATGTPSKDTRSVVAEAAALIGQAETNH
jgi:hypothetical protein